MNANLTATTKALGDLAAHATPTLAAQTLATQTLATQTLESLVSSGQNQAEKIGGQVLRSYGEITALNQRNLEALVASSTVVVKGAEEASRSLRTFARASLEQTASAGKAMLAIRSFHDLVDLQTRFAKTRMDACLAETSALTQLGVKTTYDAIAPLKAQVSAAVEKAIRPAVS